MKSLWHGSEADPLDFAPSLMRLQSRPPHPLGRRVLWGLLVLLAGLLVWSLVGRLDIVAVAEGKLIPETYVKIVQPAESGIVKEILVREGHNVQAGQVLMRMDALINEADAVATHRPVEVFRKCFLNAVSNGNLTQHAD